MIVSKEQPLLARIAWQDEWREEIIPAYLVAICNGRWFGGGMDVAPMALPDDGRLEVVTITAPNKPYLADRVRGVYTGRHLEEPTVHHFPCQRIELRLDDEGGRAPLSPRCRRRGTRLAPACRAGSAETAARASLAVRADVIGLLRCPHCGDGLSQAGAALRCARGHSFDVARQGYVNLLPGDAHTGTADSAAMVGARDAFLSAGHFAGLRDAIAKVAAGVMPAGRGDAADGGPRPCPRAAATRPATPAAAASSTWAPVPAITSRQSSIGSRIGSV